MLGPVLTCHKVTEAGEDGRSGHDRRSLAGLHRISEKNSKYELVQMAVGILPRGRLVKTTL